MLANACRAPRPAPPSAVTTRIGTSSLRMREVLMGDMGEPHRNRRATTFSRRDSAEFVSRTSARGSGTRHLSGFATPLHSASLRRFPPKRERNHLCLRTLGQRNEALSVDEALSIRNRFLAVAMIGVVMCAVALVALSAGSSACHQRPADRSRQGSGRRRGHDPRDERSRRALADGAGRRFAGSSRRLRRRGAAAHRPRAHLGQAIRRRVRTAASSHRRTRSISGKLFG